MKRMLLAGSCLLLATGVVVVQHSTPTTFAQATPDKPAQPKGFKVTPVFKSSMTAGNRPIEYPAGKPEITAVTA